VWWGVYPCTLCNCLLDLGGKATRGEQEERGTITRTTTITAVCPANLLCRPGQLEEVGKAEGVRLLQPGLQLKYADLHLRPRGAESSLPQPPSPPESTGVHMANPAAREKNQLSLGHCDRRAGGHQVPKEGGLLPRRGEDVWIHTGRGAGPAGDPSDQKILSAPHRDDAEELMS